MEPSRKYISQKEIAELVGISPAFLCHILKGRKRCPPMVAQRFEDNTGINRDVLVFGKPEEIRQALHQIMYRRR
jgi:hypothetical protein